MDVVSAINGCAGRGRDLGESVAKSVMGVVCATNEYIWLVV